MWKKEPILSVTLTQRVVSFVETGHYHISYLESGASHFGT